MTADGQDDHGDRHEGTGSCRCTGSLSASVVQRALPWNVMKKRRDMLEAHGDAGTDQGVVP